MKDNGFLFEKYKLKVISDLRERKRVVNRDVLELLKRRLTKLI